RLGLYQGLVHDWAHNNQPLTTNSKGAILLQCISCPSLARACVEWVRQLQIEFPPSPSRRGTALQDFNRPLDSAAILFADMDQFSAGDGKQWFERSEFRKKDLRFEKRERGQSGR